MLAHGNKPHNQPNVEIHEPEKLTDNNAEINQLYLKLVKPIFQNKCLTCHGVNNSLPWYHAIPGVKQLMNNDMKEAKEHLDMSFDFPFKGHGSNLDDLKAIAKSIEKDTMPLTSYRLLHWDSKLTKEEAEKIKTWLNFSISLLEAK